MTGVEIQEFSLGVVALVRSFAYTVIDILGTKLSVIFDNLTLNNPVFDFLTDVVSVLFELVGDPTLLHLLLGAFVAFSAITLVKWVLDLLPFF